MSQYNSRTCQCSTQQYAPFIFNSVAYQNSANNVYESKKELVIASMNGTLGSSATGNCTFKSNYERMQFLLGKQNRANCAVPAKVFALGTN